MKILGIILFCLANMMSVMAVPEMYDVTLQTGIACEGAPFGIDCQNPPTQFVGWLEFDFEAGTVVSWDITIGTHRWSNLLPRNTITIDRIISTEKVAFHLRSSRALLFFLVGSPTIPENETWKATTTIDGVEHFIIGPLTSASFTLKDVPPCPSSASFQVLDALDREVGMFLDFSGEHLQRPRVIFEIGGRLVILSAVRSGLSAAAGLRFESSDCTGTPYLEVLDAKESGPGANENLLGVAAISAPGRTLYLASAEDIVQNVTLRSELNRDGACSRLKSFDAYVQRAEPVADVDSLFMPPFRLSSISRR